MFERQQIADRLVAQAEICEIAAALYSPEQVAADFTWLAEECRRIASAVIKSQPTSWKH
jgi:hypothetical protein